MQDKNSRFPKLFSLAKFATFRSSVAAPTCNMFLFSILIKEKSLISFITTPFTPLSLNKVFEPAPKITVFRFSFLEFFKDFYFFCLKIFWIFPFWIFLLTLVTCWVFFFNSSCFLSLVKSFSMLTSIIS